MRDYSKEKEQFERLLHIMDELRERCPWDKKQTIESLRPLTIEETYELADAILDKDYENIKKELGDILLHLVFYARIGREEGKFDMAESIDLLCNKLIHRHPHIYGDTIVTNEEQVKENWEKLKLKEGNKSILAGVPKSLPAMVKATRIQEKARAVGFDWDDKNQVWDKVNEELAEFKFEIDKESSKEKLEGELGDLFFSIINFARFLNLDPESALERTNKKFIHRFNFLEAESKKDGKELSDMSLAEMDVYWERAKSQI
jgi:XTP/dITP diphosphohydrolase